MPITVSNRSNTISKKRLLIYETMYKYAAKNKSIPSQRELARISHTSVTWVNKTLKYLEEIGYIERNGDSITLLIDIQDYETL